MSFTPTQLRILAVLADGCRHRPAELRACLPDDQAQPVTLRVHLSNIRRVLLSKGQNIVCEYHNRTFYYRHVQLLTPALITHR